MSDIIKTPEGVEIDLVVYLTSPSKGLDVRYALRGMRAITPIKVDLDITAVAKTAGVSKFADDWRLMTYAEVTAYKAEEDED